MKARLFLLLFIASTALFMAGCLKTEEITQELTEPNLPEQAYNYTDISFPPGLDVAFGSNAPNVFVVNTDPVNFFGGIDNPTVTDEGATLGRVLFYDKRLSINNSIACASCHRQELAFADFRASSVGFGGKVTPRNSMAIINVALNRNLFWDSRVHSAKELILQPIQNHIEMGMESLSTLEKKLNNTPFYAELFKNAYGDGQVTSERIADAMAQFLCSMVSANSRFDQGQMNNFVDFTAQEKLGMNLFFSSRTKCSECHAGANFMAEDHPGGPYGTPTTRGSANTGLDAVTRDPGFRDGQFRIPSLRNIALTAPYMHDGRFATLEEVIDFYDHGIQAHPNLDPKLVGDDGEPLRLNLTSMEKQALVAFLNTLTDQTLVKDEKFSDPFN